jgi:hypothetical protein
MILKIALPVESRIASTKVEIDFSGQFIDNRSKGSIFGSGTDLRMPSCNPHQPVLPELTRLQMGMMISHSVLFFSKHQKYLEA